MKHETTAHERHQQLGLGRHVSATLVFVIQLLKDLVKVLNVLVDRLGPSVQFPVKRVEFTVKKLRARGYTHETLALKSERGLQALRIRQALKLALNLF